VDAHLQEYIEYLEARQSIEPDPSLNLVLEELYEERDSTRR
jgi:hypothetical protein